MEQGGAPKAPLRLCVLSIIPWVLGSLLSPLNQPHLVLIALPPTSLLLLIAAYRIGAIQPKTRTLWTLSILLCAISVARFLIFPVLSEIYTGAQHGEVGTRLEHAIRVFVALKLSYLFLTGAIGGYSLWTISVKVNKGRWA